MGVANQSRQTRTYNVDVKAATETNIVNIVLQSVGPNLTAFECEIVWPRPVVDASPEPLIDPAAVAAGKPEESAGPRPVTEAKLIVIEPMIKSEVPNENGVPEIVIAELPSNTSVPSKANPFG